MFGCTKGKEMAGSLEANQQFPQSTGTPPCKETEARVVKSPVLLSLWWERNTAP